MRRPDHRGAAAGSFDAFVFIDPAWLARHPGHSIGVDPGVGEFGPAPEPAEAALPAAGLGALALARRRAAAPRWNE